MFETLFPTYVLESEGVKGEWKGDNLETAEFQGVKYFKVREGLFVRWRQTSLNKMSPHKYSSNVTLILSRKVGWGWNGFHWTETGGKRSVFTPWQRDGRKELEVFATAPQQETTARRKQVPFLLHWMHGESNKTQPRVHILVPEEWTTSDTAS